MFNIVTPRAYDRIFINIFPGLDTNYCTVSLLASDSKSVSKIGIPPHTYGGDQFKNKNCDHFNIKGTVVALQTGISKRIASAYYNSRPEGGYQVWLPDWITYGTKAKTQTVIIPKQDFHYETPPMYFRRWPRWYRDFHSIHITWVNAYRVKVDCRIVSNQVNSTITNIQRTVSYCEFNSDYSKIKRRGYTSLNNLDKMAAWIDLSQTAWSLINPNMVYTVPNNSNTFPYTAADIYQRTYKLREKLRSDDSSSFGHLSVDTAQGLKVIDFKLGLFLFDWTKIFTDWKSLVSVVKSPTLKTLSSSFLSYKYGISMTYQDTKEFLGSFRKTVETVANGITRARGRLNRVRSVSFSGVTKECVDQYNMSIYCSVYPASFARFFNSLLVADFFPTTELVWDIIPFSFVVDWFLRVGDELEALDTRTLLSTYDIYSCVYSRRSVITYDVGELFPALKEVYQGELTVVDFHRYVSKSCPPYQPLSGIMPTRPFTHWVEGAALIVQRV